MFTGLAPAAAQEIATCHDAAAQLAAETPDITPFGDTLGSVHYNYRDIHIIMGCNYDYRNDLHQVLSVELDWTVSKKMNLGQFVAFIALLGSRLTGDKVGSLTALAFRCFQAAQEAEKDGSFQATDGRTTLGCSRFHNADSDSANLTFYKRHPTDIED